MQWDRGQGLREIQGPELPAPAFTMAKPGSHRGARGDGREDGRAEFGRPLHGKGVRPRQEGSSAPGSGTGEPRGRGAE